MLRQAHKQLSDQAVRTAGVPGIMIEPPLQAGFAAQKLDAIQ
jgi:hypothetical protein